MKKGVYISTSQDPYENQSLEAYLFNDMKEYDIILMLYVNEPCVVIGRNQNPWTEINLKAASSKGISILRRLSGGGTVYHDLGNLNFSFIYNKGCSTVSENFKVVIEAIKDLGIELSVNKRNDLCYEKYKISGNAFYNKGKRHMHHGTLLVDTDFTDLWQILKFDKDAFKTKSVSSVRSEVMNLNLISETASINSIIEQLVRHHQGAPVDISKRYDDTYKSWTWIYGQTPQFTYSGNSDFKVKSGRVIEIDGREVEECKVFTLD